MSSVQRARLVPAGTVLGGVLALELGAVLAAPLIPRVGLVGVVALRLVLGALMLSLLARPAWRRVERTEVPWIAVVALGLMVHHLAFYAAVHRLPLGMAVTLEFIGPLLVALLGSRRPIDLVLALGACVGVVMSVHPAGGDVDVLGVVAGLLAGASWAAYIVCFPRLAAQAGSRRGLSLANGAAAVLVLPALLMSGDVVSFTPGLVVWGLGIALLSDVIAYTLQASALTRLPGAVFSVLVSTEPAVGAILGLILLGQPIAQVQWAGIAPW
ncbi:MAG: EamA family transporter [Ornithinimicrobium sp.]